MSSLTKPQLIYMLLTKEANVQSAVSASRQPTDIAVSTVQPATGITRESSPMEAANTSRQQMLGYARYLRDMSDRAGQVLNTQKANMKNVSSAINDEKNSLDREMKSLSGPMGGGGSSVQKDLLSSAATSSSFLNQTGLAKAANENPELIDFMCETARILLSKKQE